MCSSWCRDFCHCCYPLGKSTLLKLMTGELQPTEGDVKRHSHLSIAKYHQHSVDALDPKVTVLEFFQVGALLPQSPVLSCACSANPHRPALSLCTLHGCPTLYVQQVWEGLRLGSRRVRLQSSACADCAACCPSLTRGKHLILASMVPCSASFQTPGDSRKTWRSGAASWGATGCPAVCRPPRSRSCPM